MILRAETLDEIYWHLRARGELNFECEQFIADVLETREQYFVRNDEKKDEGVLDQIGWAFNNFFGNK